MLGTPPPSDRPAPADGEIEITPEMIEAGAAALAECSSDYYDPEDVAAAIYRAMETVRRLAPA
jgi:hypothetical protein